MQIVSQFVNNQYMKILQGKDNLNRFYTLKAINMRKVFILIKSIILKLIEL